MTTQHMKFTWKGYLLAPLLVPFVFAVLLISSGGSRSPVLGLLVVFAIGSVFSYCVTAFLFLPCLYLLSRFAALTVYLTCIAGALLGSVAYLLFAWQGFQASGVNSGPPAGRFVDYLLRDLSDPLGWALFSGGGLVTAALYWMLVNQPQRRAPGEIHG